MDRIRFFFENEFTGFLVTFWEGTTLSTKNCGFDYAPVALRTFKNELLRGFWKALFLEGPSSCLHEVAHHGGSVCTNGRAYEADGGFRQASNGSHPGRAQPERRLDHPV